MSNPPGQSEPVIPPDCSASSISAWNQRVEWELRREYQLLAQAAALEIDKPSLSQRLPSTFALAAASVTQPGGKGSSILKTRPSLPENPSAGFFKSSRPRMMCASLIAIAVSVLGYAVSIYEASPEERPLIVIKMAKDAMAAAVAAGLTTKVVEELGKALRSAAGKIADTCTTKVLTEGASFIATNAIPAAAALYGPAITAILSLYHIVAGALTSDDTARAAHFTEAKAKWTLDNAVRMASSALAVFASSVNFGAATGGLMAGPVGVIAGILVFAAITVVTEHIIEVKDERGGWTPWIKSCVWPSSRPVWAGGHFDTVEMSITPDLRCPITYGLVVDPVIGGHTGQVYERWALYEHLTLHGRDPLTNLPASALSYKQSPVARRRAKEFAKHYGAWLQ